MYLFLQVFYATAVKINARHIAVNVVPRGLRGIRVRQDRRGLREIRDVRVLKVTREIQALWALREYRALLVRGGQEEIQAR